MQLISLVALIPLALGRSGMAAATVKPPVGLSPTVAGLININDFQGFGLNLVDNAVAGPGEGTAVFVFPGAFASSINQEVRGSNYHLANGLNSSLFLSYPAATFGGNPYGAELVVSSKFPATFSLQPIGSSGTSVRIVELGSGLALTSWKAVPGMSGAPQAILAQVDASLQPQQTWTLVAAPIF
ncbi:hypothetical protein MVEN_02614100 [Mycena venus]|uniref:Secreted protein n=1 Tax=Mycena venus TaxID=2733690 RepID=A0A8H6U193_9AGAR|nr:hypothetical protein MVEN_02614100 [Mycena venus]